MVASPRFGFDDILGNETVDFNVLDSNFDIADAGAAHLALANSFSQVQSITRPAAANPALTVQVAGDTAPRLTITADGSLTWPTGSINIAGGSANFGNTTINTARLLTGAGTAAAP